MTIHDDLENACVHIEQIGEDQIVSEFLFKKSTSFFRGHFPGKPLLPGILQLEMIRYSLEQQRGLALDMRSIRKTKFTDQILPEDRIAIHIGLRKDRDMITAKATVKANGKLAGRATIAFAENVSIQE